MNIYNTKQLMAKMCSMSLIRGPIVLLFFPMRYILRSTLICLDVILRATPMT